MTTKLLTLTELAGEAGISQQALDKHLAAGNVEPDFVANQRLAQW